MEKGIDSHIKEYFDLPKVDVATYSPLALAYIGDGIYDLVIRSIVVGKGNTKASRLHQTTSHLVKAHAQATMMETLTPMLTEDETEIYRRGRATGFEALMGYLYLTDQFERILELAKEAIRHYNVKTGKNDLAGGK